MAGDRQRRGPDARTQGPIRLGEWVVGRNAVEDGRGRLFCFAMQSALQRAAENSWQLTLCRRAALLPPRHWRGRNGRGSSGLR